MPVRSIPCAVVLVLAACSSPEEVAEQAGVAESPEATAVATADATVDPGPRELAEETELYLFKQSWPEKVGEIPALAGRLAREGLEARKELAEQAEEDRKATEGAGFPYNKHSYGEEWKVVAETPGWLSLSNEVYSFMGGAHGMYGKESLVWNKQTDTGVPGIELFASPAVLEAALGQKLCDALDAERLRRRGPDYIPDSEGLFSLCPDLEEATVLVGSSSRRAFDRITIYFGPYVAGPYAEGAYELSFPVDAKVLDAVKPEYRPAFTIRR